MKPSKFVRVIRNYLFSAIVLPCTLLVCLTFWSIYVMDKKLVCPKCVDENYPSWLNHAIHSVIVLPLIIEMSLPKKYDFVKFWKALVILTAFVIAYQVMFLNIYFEHNVWIYPVFKYLTWFQRILFLSMLYGWSIMFLYLGIYLKNWKGSVTINEEIKEN
ncbi:Far-17a AIG1 domain containing protein [Asbolus verrucosus]|uniref:Far-17a AIG1 domain containing protein n=1 Tax=Asbolus verrucosus TaxID=1661398 RepID=A0A482VBY1_ASBVE|nr:Far-17a AIG1 domain containing protein [Asbolus verrucosus]